MKTSSGKTISYKTNCKDYTRQDHLDASDFYAERFKKQKVWLDNDYALAHKREAYNLKISEALQH